MVISTKLWTKGSPKRILMNSVGEILLCEECPCDVVITNPFSCLCSIMPSKICLVTPSWGYLTLYYNSHTNDYTAVAVHCAPWFGRITARLYCQTVNLGDGICDVGDYSVSSNDQNFTQEDIGGREWIYGAGSFPGFDGVQTKQESGLFTDKLIFADPRNSFIGCNSSSVLSGIQVKFSWGAFTSSANIPDTNPVDHIRLQLRGPSGPIGNYVDYYPNPDIVGELDKVIGDYTFDLWGCSPSELLDIRGVEFTFYFNTEDVLIYVETNFVGQTHPVHIEFQCCGNTIQTQIPYLDVTVEGVGSVLNFPQVCGSIGTSSHEHIPSFSSPDTMGACNPRLDITLPSGNRIYDPFPNECISIAQYGTCQPFPDVPLAIVLCSSEPFYFYDPIFDEYIRIALNGSFVLYKRILEGAGRCRYYNGGILLQSPAWALTLPIADENVSGVASFDWNGNQDIWNGLHLDFTSSSIVLYRAVGEDFVEIHSGDIYVIAIGSCETDLTCEGIQEQTYSYPEKVLLTIHSDCSLFDGLQYVMDGFIAGGTPDRLSYTIGEWVELYHGTGSHASLWGQFTFVNNTFGGPVDEYAIFLDFTINPATGFNPPGQRVIEQSSFTCNPLLFESDEVDIAGAIGGAIDPGSDPTHPIWTTCGFTIRMSFTVEGI